MILSPFQAFPKYKQSFSLKPFLGSQRSGLKWQVYNRVWAADYEKVKFIVDRIISYMSLVCLLFVFMCIDIYKLN